MAFRAVRLRDATGYEAYPVGLHLLDLAFGDPPAILDAGLPGLAPSKVAKLRAAPPKTPEPTSYCAGHDPESNRPGG
jgi:hypothetical protein